MVEISRVLQAKKLRWSWTNILNTENAKTRPE
jgi:hypothetical protein